MRDKKSVAVIGGGVSGLVAAWRLLRSGFRVTVFEKSEVLGGLARCVKFSDTPLEVYYHHFFPSDSHIIRLFEEIGITDGQIAWNPSKMGYLSNGNIYDFSTPFSLFFFRPLSFWDKLRFCRATFDLIKKVKKAEDIENVTAQEWISANMGDAVFEVIWKPLLLQKFGQAFDKVTMAWLWNKMVLRSQAHRDYFREEKLGYLKGSLEVLFERLKIKITESGGQIRPGRAVSRVNKKENGFTVVSHGLSEEYDYVFSSISPDKLDCIADFPMDFRGRLDSFAQLAVICAIVVLKRQLTDYYWLNIGDNTFPFGLAVEHTNLCDPRDYGCKHVVYLSKYIHAQDKLFSTPDKEIEELFLGNLKRINKDFDLNWVEKLMVFRDTSAQPLITRGYSRLKPGYETPWPGFWWVGANHIYPQDRGLNHAIMTAEEAVNRFLKTHVS